MSITKINKIVSAGCSFTFGEELVNPQIESWPYVVSQNLGVGCVNLGWPGASNEHIVNCVIDYCSNNDISNTFFTVMWTHFSRQLFCRSENYKFIRNISITWPAEYDRDLKTLLFTKYYNEDFLFKKTLMQIILLQNFFHANNCPYIMCTSMGHSAPDVIHDDLQPLINMIDKTKYKGFLKDSFDTLTTPAYRSPKGHPNAMAHKEMADIITQWISNDYQV